MFCCGPGRQPLIEVPFLSNRRIWVKTSANLIPLLLLVLVSAITMLGFASKWIYISELASHFRLACLYAATALVFYFGIRKTPKQAIVATVMVMVNAIQIAPYFFHDKQIADESIGTKISITQMNLFGDRNNQYSVVLSRIRETNPDLVVLSECTGNWALHLSEQLKEYKYVSAYRGVGLFSKLPLSNTTISCYGALNRPAIQTTCTKDGHDIRVFAVHPLVPIGHFADRNGQMAEFARDVRLSRIPVVIAGDMNCGPWSHYFSRLLKDGKLRDTQLGFGVQPSWPVLWNMVPLIPIDHCLISDGLVALNRKTLGNIGSDHLPVYVEIGVIKPSLVSINAKK